jgi:hypothetical protein
MERLHILIDSYDLSTVSASLVKLATEYDLTITISGTMEGVLLRHAEIEQLLMPVIAARNTKDAIKYIFGIGNPYLAVDPDVGRFAFKLHDFGRRGQ